MYYAPQKTSWQEQFLPEKLPFSIANLGDLGNRRGFLKHHPGRLNPQLHLGEQGNQIYIGDREALPSLTLRFAQRAAVRGDSLLPDIIL